ncbi:MAG: phosphatase PAP2 family protein [Elusimicrobiaceae bacterium]|nr:phosphatase PAP2 family protein [Elusimicrobiaceae bacterium]
MPLITRLGSSFFIVPLGLVLMLVPRRRYRVAGIVLFAALVLGQTAVDIMKELFARGRPFQSLDWVRQLVEQGGYSFPSGHTAAAFLTAYVMAWSFKEFKWQIYSLAALVGISRMYVGVHYPSDVLAGALAGLGAGWFAVSVARQVLAGEGGSYHNHHHGYGGNRHYSHGRHDGRREQGKFAKTGRQEAPASAPAGQPGDGAQKNAQPRRSNNRPRFNRGRRGGARPGNGNMAQAAKAGGAAPAAK